MFWQSSFGAAALDTGIADHPFLHWIEDVTLNIPRDRAESFQHFTELCHSLIDGTTDTNSYISWSNNWRVDKYEFARALQAWPHLKDANLKANDLATEAYYRDGQETNGPTLRWINRGLSVAELENNLDHIDLPLTFEHILNHEKFWKVFKVIETPELDKIQSLTQQSIHGDTVVSGKRKPKVAQRYSEQTEANRSQHERRPSRQTESDSSAHADARRERKKARVIQSDDDSDEDTAKREDIADDSSSIATMGSLRILSRGKVDDSHRPRDKTPSPSFIANDSFLTGDASTLGKVKRSRALPKSTMVETTVTKETLRTMESTITAQQKQIAKLTDDVAQCMALLGASQTAQRELVANGLTLANKLELANAKIDTLQKIIHDNGSATEAQLTTFAKQVSEVQVALRQGFYPTEDRVAVMIREWFETKGVMLVRQSVATAISDANEDVMVHDQGEIQSRGRAASVAATISAHTATPRVFPLRRAPTNSNANPLLVNSNHPSDRLLTVGAARGMVYVQPRESVTSFGFGSNVTARGSTM